MVTGQLEHHATELDYNSTYGGYIVIESSLQGGTSAAGKLEIDPPVAYEVTCQVHLLFIYAVLLV